MFKYIPILIVIAGISILVTSANSSHHPGVLSISEEGRHIIQENGEPFIWMGDTAWELVHKLSREEASEYLENRAAKHFTVIQTVVLAELDGVRTPNYYGDLPLINKDPTKWNEPYFEHLDYIIDKAASLGLYIGLLPTWGDKIISKNMASAPPLFLMKKMR